MNQSKQVRWHVLRDMAVCPAYDEVAETEAQAQIGMVIARTTYRGLMIETKFYAQDIRGITTVGEDPVLFITFLTSAYRPDGYMMTATDVPAALKNHELFRCDMLAKRSWLSWVNNVVIWYTGYVAHLIARMFHKTP